MLREKNEMWREKNEMWREENEMWREKNESPKKHATRFIIKIESIC